jgi:hypothetical protein
MNKNKAPLTSCLHICWWNLLNTNTNPSKFQLFIYVALLLIGALGVVNTSLHCHSTYTHSHMGERFESCTYLCKNIDFSNWSWCNTFIRNNGKTRTSSKDSDFLDWVEVRVAFGSNLVKVEWRTMLSLVLFLILALLLFKLIRLMLLLISIIDKILAG